MVSGSNVVHKQALYVIFFYFESNFTVTSCKGKCKENGEGCACNEGCIFQGNCCDDLRTECYPEAMGGEFLLQIYNKRKASSYT